MISGLGWETRITPPDHNTLWTELHSNRTLHQWGSLHTRWLRDTNRSALTARDTVEAYTQTQATLLSMKGAT